MRQSPLRTDSNRAKGEDSAPDNRFVYAPNRTDDLVPVLKRNSQRPDGNGVALFHAKH